MTAIILTFLAGMITGAIALFVIVGTVEAYRHHKAQNDPNQLKLNL